MALIWTYQKKILNVGQNESATEIKFFKFLLLAQTYRFEFEFYLRIVKIFDTDFRFKNFSSKFWVTVLP